MVRVLRRSIPVLMLVSLGYVVLNSGLTIRTHAQQPTGGAAPWTETIESIPLDTDDVSFPVAEPTYIPPGFQRMRSTVLYEEKYTGEIMERLYMDQSVTYPDPVAIFWTWQSQPKVPSFPGYEPDIKVDINGYTGLITFPDTNHLLPETSLPPLLALEWSDGVTTYEIMGTLSEDEATSIARSFPVQ